MEARMTRRALLKAGLLLAGGSLVGPGCAPARTAPRGGMLPPRTRALVPVKAEADRVIRAVAGLRPYRPSGFVVRAERLDGKMLVHNYGHGGGGISLSWGSAELAAQLARDSGQGRFAVLGSGVMGLTTARRLQDRGLDVTIYTRDLPPETTSNIAGGHWTPTSVFASEAATPAFLAQFESAARFAHRYFQNLPSERYGVRWIENYLLRDEQPRGEPLMAGRFADLYPDMEMLGPGQHPFPAPYAQRVVTMLVEPAVLLDTLTRDFLLRGGRIVVREFHDRAELLALEEPVVVNCCGLGSRALFGDAELTPVRGQLAVLLPQPEVDYILLSGSQYMFPRSDGIVLGGTFERGEWSTEPDPGDIQRIVAAHRAMFERMG